MSTTSTTLTLAVGTRYQFRVRATDGSGSWGDWATAPAFTPTVQQESSSAVTWTGSWSRDRVQGSWDKFVRWAAIGGATATFTFTGSSAAWVAPESPAGGVAEVWLDGAPAATVDLYAAASQQRVTVFAQNLVGTSHSLQVRVSGTRNPASSSSRVDVDAFLVLG